MPRQTPEKTREEPSNKKEQRKEPELTPQQLQIIEKIAQKLEENGKQ